MAFARFRELVEASRSIVVLTGAGISTDSGIPDFRGPNGLWTRNPAAEKASNLQAYLSEPEVRRAAWEARVASQAWTAVPNPGHRAVADLETTGKLSAVVTQNIDELHQRAGSSPGLVIEVHGTMHRYRCWGCQDSGPMALMLDRVRAGESDPPCLKCGGIVKSDTISFGQALDPEVIDRAMAVAASCDLLVAVGSTLQVYPVAGAVPLAHKSGASVVIVNADPTPFDGIADAVVRGSISEVLPAAFVGQKSDTTGSPPSE